jgi:aminoglycoside 2'-N-acetyltransferase I
MPPDCDIVVTRDEHTPTRLLDACHALVVEAFGRRFTDADWLHATGGWRVIALAGDHPVGHAAVVPRRLQVGEQDLASGYVEAMATAAQRQGRGVGSALLTAVNEIVRNEYALGALSTGRHSFYERLGWQRWRGASYVRDGVGVVRTADEDDGLMVLRFGPSAHLDLTASITCDARPGDDW